MEAFSERLLREHQPAWQAMQQHPFVTDIEQDRRTDSRLQPLSGV